MIRYFTSTIVAACFCLSAAHAQLPIKQYFDGADTSATQSINIVRETAPSNIWQIGKPQKIIFNAAATAPNVIVTDILYNYPVNNISRFTFQFKDSIPGGGGGLQHIIAVRWKQKLDLQKHEDGGIVEFSRNGGPWQNAFNNTSVYNFYGFNQANKDTLNSGEYAFSGTDTTYRDIWLCYRNIVAGDSMAFRFTLKTDSNSNAKEGWMIDNMLVQRTFAHIVGKIATGHDSKVYPSSTSGTIFIEAEHKAEQHFIKSIQIVDAAGRRMRDYKDEQQRFIIYIGDLPNGTYYVRVTTNLGAETFPVLLTH